MISPAAETLLKLIRIAVGNEDDFTLPVDIDWREVIELSYEQGVAAIACDGLQIAYDRNPALQLPLDSPEMEQLKYDWFGAAIACEQEYSAHRGVISELSSWYASHGLHMMLLKGYGLSLNYPVPAHRPTGDIDIYLGDGWELADRLISEEEGVKLDNSHHHHSVFTYKGVSVENHYDFINVHSHKSARWIEALLKGMAKENPVVEEIDGTSLLLPSPDFNALFVAKHNAGHFASTGMTLRQLLDWLLFVRVEGHGVNWRRVYPTYMRAGMVRFVNIMNTVGVRYLGFGESLFHDIEYDSAICERVLCDILSPECSLAENGTLLRSLWVKPVRWWRNRWKHRLCYRDSLLSSFLWGVHAKLMKPGHFLR